MIYYKYRNIRLGTRVEIRDKSASYQCVDLALDWAVIGWGLELSDIGRGNAVKMWTQGVFPSKTVWAITNQANNCPPTGAIVVFDATNANSAGHVAIVDSASTISLNVLEQNGGGNGTGLGKDAVAIRKHSYTGTKYVGAVLGWFVPKISWTTLKGGHLGPLGTLP